MQRNIHPIERAVRVLVGLVLTGLVVFLGKTPWLALPGVVMLFTGFSGWCPPYQLLGISTCAKK